MLLPYAASTPCPVLSERVWCTRWPFVTKGHFYGDAPDPSLPITSYSVFEQGGLQDYQFLYDQIMEADYASSHPKVSPSQSKTDNQQFSAFGTMSAVAFPV